MNRGSVKKSFLIHEAVVLTGFSKYMLDYLARENIFEASLPPIEERRRGKRREYSYEDLVLLRALHAICAGRGKIRNLKSALVAFREEFGRISPGQRIARHLVVQGNELCVVTANGTMRQLRDGQMTLSLVVDLGEVRDEIDRQIDYDADAESFTLKSETAAAAEAEKAKIWRPIAQRRLASAG
jgi:hypothetical protein